MADDKPGPVIPERYAQALGDDDPIEIMATSPDRIRRLIAGLNEKQLGTKPAPGKWSIKEIIGHLADGEVVLGFRYRYIGGHDRPELPGYDQDAFVEKLGVATAKAHDLLDDFAMARAVNLGLLERLPEESWHRVGLHAERGEESIAKLVMMYAGHDRIHMQQIETIRIGLFPGVKAAKAGSRKPARKAAAEKAKKAAGPGKRKASPRKAAKKKR